MKLSRNSLCPCGSSKKYKHCCYAKDAEAKLAKTRYADPTAKKMAGYKLQAASNIIQKALMETILKRGSKKDEC